MKFPSFTRDKSGAEASHSPLLTAIKRSKRGLISIAFIGAIINLFVLNGSIYMMMVYDRAIPSGSLPTLFGLFAITVMIYVFQAIFEMLRSNMLSDVAADLEENLGKTTARAAHRQALIDPAAAREESPLQDIEQIRTFLSGPGPIALLDLPWLVFFLGVLAAMHVWLGVAAMAGAVAMTALTAMAEVISRRSMIGLGEISRKRQRLIARQRQHVEVFQSLGMRDRIADRIVLVGEQLAKHQRRFAERTSLLSISSKTMRMFIQSALLTVGALLVLSGEASGGVIFASSILSGRALAPVDQAIAQWRPFARARASWTRLDALLSRFGELGEYTALPKPKGNIEVSDLSAGPPGSDKSTISEINFAAPAGSIIGLIGPSGAGKSTLARALVGAWPAKSGTIRFDGASIDQWDSDVLGQSIGYLSQSVELFEGTVAENIARFDRDAQDVDIIQAALAAGVHELILELPKGYDTPVGDDGGQLSGGQRQRIGLARALYGKPSIVVLDEPNSNLDPKGETALASALVQLRQRGATAIVVTHRNSMLSVASHLIHMADGKIADFGPRDKVIADVKARSNAQPKQPQTANG